MVWYLGVTSTNELASQHSDPHKTSTEHFYQWQYITATFCCCWFSDFLLLWHFVPYLICQGTVTNADPLKVERFVTVLARLPFFTWIMTGRALLFWSEMWTFFYMSPGHTWKFFGLFARGGQNVTMVKIRAWWWDILAHGSIGRVP
jgi:hypothetical protein